MRELWGYWMPITWVDRLVNYYHQPNARNTHLPCVSFSMENGGDEGEGWDCDDT